MATKNGPAVIEQEFGPDPTRLVEIRRLVERAAESTPLTRHQIDDLLTAVDEAAANAICHGCHGPSGKFRVAVCIEPTGLIVTVHDSGTGFRTATGAAMPGPDATGGRGLPLMCALSDSVEFASTPHGTSVTLRKFLTNR